MTKYKLVPVKPTPEMEAVFKRFQIGRCEWNVMLAAAPEVQAEPVAWLRKNGFRFLEEVEPQDDSELPLYTTPQPARQPLTDEQIEEMASEFEEGYVFLYRGFARAIEAAHGIGSLGGSGMANTDEPTRNHVTEVDILRAQIERLQSAREELLVSSKSLVEWFDGDTKESVDRRLKKARAAIAKATGETK